MNTIYHHPLALRWNRLACDAIYYTKTPPTLAARALAMVHTAIYDAWTCYSGGNCVSTTTFTRLKRPEEEWTQQNREIAFSFAAWHVLEALFAEYLPQEHKQMFASLLKEVGCAFEDQTPGIKTPQGIGILSARLVLESRLGDGSNPQGKFADYTGYVPTNEPPPVKPLINVGKWQPQVDDGGRIQKFVTPHWGLVKPFALEWGGQFRPPAPIAAFECMPPAPNAPYTARFVQQARKITQISECLTEEQKLIAEYWAGMHEDKVEDSTFTARHGYWTVPPAQSCRMARQFAKKHNFANGNVIKMFFALTNALLDASIVAWDAKEYYDYCRPVSVIHEIFDETSFKAWGGPCRGTVQMEGEGWEPYLQCTPPFPEYPSGHSTFSRATAEIIHSFWGDCEYGECVTFPPCSSVIEPDCTPAQEITLTWRTLHEAAEQAGMSRRYGGIHFEEGDVRGRELGKKVADCVWRKVCRYFDGLPA